jgi:2-keto-4-pentenoate hydratase
MTNALTTLLLAQRSNGTTLADLPAALVPASAADAYAIQNEVVAALGPVGAWKVQPIPATGFPMASPILARDVHASGTQLKSSDLPGLAIEVEVAVTIDTDLPAKAGGYQAHDIKVALRSIHVALEVLASRYRDRKAVPTLAGLADLQHNAAVIVGPAVSPAALPEFGQQQMSLAFDSIEMQSTSGDATTENMLSALAWLADHAAARGLPLKAGDVVITGARLGPIALTTGAVTAEAAGLGTVSASFV